MTRELIQKRAWQNAFMTALVNALGMLVSVAIDNEVGAVWPSILSSIIGGSSLIFLLIVRKNASARTTSLIYLANSGMVTFAFFMSNANFALLGARWVPFQGNKLGVLVASMLAPTLSTGFISIFAHVAVSVVQFMTFPSEVRSQIAAGEPWTVVAFGVAASVLLVSRFARLKLEVRAVAAEGEKIALRKAATQFLSIKDLMNTPLQTLEIAISILGKKKDSDPKLVSEMQRAVDSLTQINDELTKYQHLNGPSTPNEPLSFDAMNTLKN